MRIIRAVTTLLLLVIPAVALATDLGGFTFKQISGYDQKAVVKTPEGQLKMIGVGDAIGKAKVLDIAEERVVLEHLGPNGPETIIVRMINGKSRVERLTQFDSGQQTYRSAGK
jgi:hypothetical protein